MNKQFQTSFKRRPHRQRYYSSMNYQEFCDFYGPPPPLVKPMEDPFDQIPLLDLEEPIESDPPQKINDITTSATLTRLKMETILEIDGSQNFTQKHNHSPKIDPFPSARTKDAAEDDITSPKRMRVRMRSQSDNSQYLIFNFLERVNQNGRKRQKLEQ